MKKNNKNSPAPDALRPREICAYSLAKKNTGTKEIIATARTRFSMRNGRIRKMSTRINGDAVWSSTK